MCQMSWPLINAMRLSLISRYLLATHRSVTQQLALAKQQHSLCFAFSCSGIDMGGRGGGKHFKWQSEHGSVRARVCVCPCGLHRHIFQAHLMLCWNLAITGNISKLWKKQSCKPLHIWSNKYTSFSVFLPISHLTYKILQVGMTLINRK